MSVKGITELPDPIFGSADVGTTDRKLSVSAGGQLLHAHIGGIYIAMSERNWRTLFAAMSELEIEVEPKNYRIVFDDDTSEATVVTA